MSMRIKRPVTEGEKPRIVRKCGSCKLCCSALSVPELDKPNGVACEKLCSTGCSIYGEHPESCQTFGCAWLHGDGDVSVRPDHIGAVLHIEHGNLGPNGRALVIYVDPKRPERYKKSRYIQKLVARFVRDGMGAVVVNGEHREILTLPGSRFDTVLRGTKELDAAMRAAVDRLDDEVKT